MNEHRVESATHGIAVLGLCEPFVASSPMPIAALEGASHTVRYVNPAFCTLVGKPDQELVGNAFSGAAPNGVECLALLDRVYGTGQAETHIGEERSRSHSFYWSYCVWPVRGEDRRPVGTIIQITETTPSHVKVADMNEALMISSMRQHELTESAESLNVKLQEEITAHKLAEMALSRLAAIVQSSDDAIVSKDLNGIIATWNPGAERLFGYTAREAIGQPITIIIPYDRLYEEPRILERIRHNESIDHYETVRRRKDGRLLDISLTISPILDEHGKVVGVSKIAHDITESKRAEKERLEFAAKERALVAERALRETEAELARVVRALSVGELATSIAHEVNQPLAGVITNAEAGIRWLSGKTPDVVEALESLALVVRDGNRASGVIRRIREFLKKESRQTPSLNINEVVQESVALARAELQKRRIAVNTDLSGDIPLVHGDRIQLQQVILNLIMNAAEAMTFSPDELRQLLVTSRKSTDGGVLVAVRDAGSGIKPQDVHRIFESFYTTKPEGMGMGLSISRSIIEAHSGRIWAEANHEGPGLTVQFSLPSETDPAIASSQ